MKKFVAILSVFVLAAFVLCGCGGSVTGGGASEKKTLVSSEDITKNTEEFLGVSAGEPDGNVGNRKSTSESERKAAERLYEKYANGSEYSALGATVLSETEFELKINGQDYASQNVEIVWENPNGKGKQVIIGASYDGSYGPYDESSLKQKATGAFESATGVATLMSVIDYVAANEAELSAKIDFDIVFVFFGCGAYNSYGASVYVNKYLSANDRLDTLVMFDIDRLGGENMYMYSDETETEHENFLRNVADSCGLAFGTLPANMPIIEGVYIEDVHYAHFGMFGDQAPFFQKDIPAIKFFSGYYGGFNLSDLEMSGTVNIGGTEQDTYTNLKAERPKFAEQGSDTATLIIESMLSSGFADTMTAARASKSDYTFWTKPLWAYLTVIFAIIALCVLLIVIVKHFEKKYPFVPQVKRMKIAVFGMDYETKNDEDIFIDIKKTGNPFDGY